MIDFYLITDDTPNPDNPEETSLQLAGNLDIQVWVRLRKKAILPQELSSHLDLRITNNLIKQIHQLTLQHKFKGDPDVKKTSNYI